MQVNSVLVYSPEGERLANTTPRNAKVWLKTGKAKFYCKSPFSIKLTEMSSRQTEKKEN